MCFKPQTFRNFNFFVFPPFSGIYPDLKTFSFQTCNILNKKAQTWKSWKWHLACSLFLLPIVINDIISSIKLYYSFINQTVKFLLRPNFVEMKVKASSTHLFWFFCDNKKSSLHKAKSCCNILIPFSCLFFCSIVLIFSCWPKKKKD